MSPSSQSHQSYYHEFLRCTICSHDFEYENDRSHPITLPMCGHTMCRQCIDILRNQTKCPQDQVSFGINNTPVDQLPTNYPLLTILYDSLKVKTHTQNIEIKFENLYFSYPMIMNNVLVNVYHI